MGLGFVCLCIRVIALLGYGTPLHPFPSHHRPHSPVPTQAHDPTHPCPNSFLPPHFPVPFPPSIHTGFSLLASPPAHSDPLSFSPPSEPSPLLFPHTPGGDKRKIACVWNTPSQKTQNVPKQQCVHGAKGATEDWCVASLVHGGMCGEVWGWWGGKEAQESISKDLRRHP